MDKKNNKNFFLYFLLLMIFSFFILYPILTDTISSNRPGYEKHIITLQNFHNNLLSGNFSPKWASGLGRGYGYPVFVFRPPLIYFLQNFFKLFYLPTPVLMKIVSALTAILSAFSIFKLSSLFVEEKGVVISSIAYIFSPLIISAFLYKYNYDEILLIFLLPLNLYFIGHLANCREKTLNNRIFFQLTASMTALFLSTPATLLSFFFLIIWILITFMINSETTDRKNIYTAIASLFFSIALSSFYWIPAYAEKKFINHVYSLQKIYLSKTISYSIPLESIGIASIVLASAGITLNLMRNKINKKNKFLISLGIISLLIIFLEKYLKNPGNLINENIALALPILIVLSLLSGLIFSEENNSVKSYLLFLLIIAVLLISMGAEFLKIKSEFNPLNNRQITSEKAPYRIWHQYMPEQVKKIPQGDFEYPLEIVTGRLKILREEFAPEKRGVRVRVGDEGCKVRLNLFYYPGWNISIKETPSLPVETDMSGRIIVSLPEGIHFLRIEFKNTFIHTLSILISYAAAVFLFFIFIFYKKH